MSKKKDKKDKLPKKIAGVKVPKELRKSSHQLGRIVQEPMVREIALAALAAGLAARKDARRAAKKVALEAGDAAGEAAEKASSGGGWVKAALAAAALEAGRQIIDVIEDSGMKSTLEGVLSAPKPAATDKGSSDKRPNGGG